MASLNSHRWRAAGIAGVVASVFAVASAARLIPTLLLLNGLYLGGSDSDYATAVAVDSAGNAYIAGFTTAADLPMVRAIQPAPGGEVDAFAMKIDSAGRILWSTYIGGSRSDVATAVASDAAGNAYVAGRTRSVDFPT